MARHKSRAPVDVTVRIIRSALAVAAADAGRLAGERHVGRHPDWKSYSARSRKMALEIFRAAFAGRQP